MDSGVQFIAHQVVLDSSTELGETDSNFTKVLSRDALPLKCVEMKVSGNIWVIIEMKKSYN